jgi:hypothetical protein
MHQVRARSTNGGVRPEEIAMTRAKLAVGEIVDGMPGAGVDADPKERPGIPMELEPPRPMGAAHWKAPERQADPGGILRRKGLSQLTPVFGVTIAPRGLSGLMRRVAYGVPEHHTMHWLVLLFADRVDALESRMRRGFGLALVGAGVLAAGAAGLAFARKRASRRRNWMTRIVHGPRLLW